MTLTGSIDGTEPVHDSVLGAASTCAAAPGCPGALAGAFHYDTYTLTNPSSSPVCVTVTLSDATCIYSETYLGSFDPSNPCTNYLADSNLVSTYSYTVPGNATIVVVVEEFTVGIGCPSYTVTISGLNCGVTPTVTPEPPTNTPEPPTNTPEPPTNTPVPPTPCTITFTDVDPTVNPFYENIRCLACRGIVSGYNDGTFRWGNSVTRGQLSKIIAGAAGLNAPIPPTQQTFEDVPGGANPNPFWLWIERLAATGAINGYSCGTIPSEPCGTPPRPYFRWGNSATRGQISKITAVTAGWNGPIPSTQQTFEDVPGGATPNPFWLWIEELAGRGIISGYNCGTVPGEPCGTPPRPYFRWGADATRGQMSKIAASAFFPNCQTPAKR
jgi:hypothetical protein